MTEGLFADAVTETYNDVIGLIWEQVHKHKARYGGDLDELFSRANFIFMRAYKTHNPNCASFITWVRARVWNDLFDMMRKDQRRDIRVNMQGSEIIENDDAEAVVNDYSVCKLKSKLSSEGCFVVDITLNTNIPYTKTGNISFFRLTKHLEALGWANNQIITTFKEIRKAL